MTFILFLILGVPLFFMIIKVLKNNGITNKVLRIALTLLSTLIISLIIYYIALFALFYFFADEQTDLF